MNRNRSRIPAVIAATVLGGLVTATPASANNGQCGTTYTVVALYGYEHANYQGTRYSILRPSCGTVDAGGYQLRPGSAARNNISSIKRGPYSGSSLTVWEEDWSGTGLSGRTCHYGYLPPGGLAYVGDVCNDDIGRLDVWGPK